jgi:haloalkane dehalogenase
MSEVVEAGELGGIVDDKRTVAVGDSFMAYRDVGEGDPILFLHGNPMSSYLWRNVIAQVQDLGRCIVPDLIGMGDSGRLPKENYRFATHRSCLDAFCDALELRDRVVIVGHDWGGPLGFDWAHRHPEAVRGIAYGETLVHPNVGDHPPERAELVKWSRSPEGEAAILNGDFLLDIFMQASTLKPLAADAEAEYRRVWSVYGESRRPMLTWVQEVPSFGEPQDVYQAIESYSKAMVASTVPKLLIVSTQGQMAGPDLEFCRTWANQTEVAVEAKHFFQEDAPEAVGQALRDWIGTLP